MCRMGSIGTLATSSYKLSTSQLDYELSIRSGNTEKGAYFDDSGNILLQSSGNADFVEFNDMAQFNHQVEQRVWNNENIHFVHNHPFNTIFSPEDIQNFEYVENKSVSAVLPNGTTYRLIREQPITSTRYVERDGELVRQFEPKKIAGEYDKAYTKIWDKKYSSVEARDKAIAGGMSNWLRQNAKKYGYRFIQE